MKRVTIAAAFAAFAALPATASTLNDSFTSLFFLGDSLVDTGNIVPSPLPPVYYQAPDKPGRQFSNGPVISDVLDDDFGGHGGLSPAARTYAFGGARVGPGGPTPDYATQIALFLGDLQDANLGQAEPLFPGTPVPGARPLVGTWIGANDAFALIGAVESGQIDRTTALAGASLAAQGVAAGIARMTLVPGLDDFLVLNLPDLGRVPAAGGYADPTLGTDIAAAFNASLGLSLAALQGDGTRIEVLDVFGVLGGVLDDIEAGGTPYGFANGTMPCLAGATVCADPDSYVFWDAVHPTAMAHGVLAGLVRDLYAPETEMPSEVPVGPALPLLATGLGLLMLVRRRA